jgi:cytochrome c-type biogenesis protein CcmI
MSSAQWIAMAAITLPALAIVLWPLVRGGAGRAAPSNAAPDRRLELAEEKAATYRALKELDFDHEAGSLSDDDFQALRDRYEGRAAELITALDTLGGPAPPPARASAARAALRTRSPGAMVAGGLSFSPSASRSVSGDPLHAAGRHDDSAGEPHPGTHVA